MSERLSGTPSDEVAAILASGSEGVAALFVSLSARHPSGEDAEYLAWHGLDHRPEQHRLAALRASLRLVSTPECRRARAASDPRLDATDHVMTYFFADTAGLSGFSDLAAALRRAGRMPHALPPVERGVYRVCETSADPRIRIGADVLPWWPAAGVYLIVEARSAAPPHLIGIAGVAGTWSAVAEPVDPTLATAPAGQRITYAFLDGDPVATAFRLRRVLERRFRDTGLAPLLAAPFHSVTPHEWERHLP